MQDPIIIGVYMHKIKQFINSGVFENITPRFHVWMMEFLQRKVALHEQNTEKNVYFINAMHTGLRSL